MMYILGLSCYYHDASAALIKDGVVVAAAEEERFTRKKHDSSFPINAIEFCLKDAGITAAELDAVAFYEKPMLKLDRLLHTFLQSFPRGYWQFYKAMPPMMTEKLRLPSILKKKIKFTGKIIYVEHHMSHAASSYYCSGYPEAAILTNDGVGEWTCSALGVGRGRDLKLIKEIKFPHSLGLVYSTVTAFLGFKVNNDEYKVMGLAPYGKPKYIDRFRQIVDVKDDGSYKLNMEYFSYHHKMKMFSDKFIELFGEPRTPDSEMTSYYEDISTSLQAFTEEVLLKQITYLSSIVETPYLCIAGGVGLNSVANGKILKNTKFKHVYIHPASGDGGGSIGAALYAYHQVLGWPRNGKLEHAFLGPSFGREEIIEFFKNEGVTYKELSTEEMISTTASLLANNNVIGWFQGRMEWGPRALGARSILSNPTNVEMKDILNAKVKHREMFRPFAPVVTVEDAHRFFECDVPVPEPTDYMLMVYPIKKEWQKKIPAVTHVDGSGRLQTIRRAQNPRYYDLIKAFEKLKGVPILINTSFNIRGEPIVCTPADAFRCMMGTGIDYLVIENFLVARDDNPLHMWDSEDKAKAELKDIKKSNVA